MSAENPQKTFGTIVSLTGVVYFLIAIVQLIFSYSELLEVSGNQTFDDKVSTFSMLLEFLAQRMLPFSVIALALGGIAYPQLYTKLVSSFTLIVAGLLIVLNCYYWLTNPTEYCGGSSLMDCTTKIAPIIGMIISIGLMAKEIKKSRS